MSVWYWLSAGFSWTYFPVMRTKRVCRFCLPWCWRIGTHRPTAYYTRVRKAGASGGRKAWRGCLRNARLGGQNIIFYYKHQNIFLYKNVLAFSAGFKYVEALGRIIIGGPYPASNAIIYNLKLAVLDIRFCLQKELQSLRHLCQKKGASDDEIMLCKPKRSRESLVIVLYSSLFA